MDNRKTKPILKQTTTTTTTTTKHTNNQTNNQNEIKRTQKDDNHYNIYQHLGI